MSDRPVSDGASAGSGSARVRGVGIEWAERLLRGVRIGAEGADRISSAAEFPIGTAGDEELLDALILLYAELGSPEEPTRIAAFPPGSVLQRTDVTGRDHAEVRDIRTQAGASSMATSMIVADGPRRWLLLIRWDDEAIERIRRLAERAGFVDVAVEPSALSIARVAGADATYVRRLVAQGEAHHAVVSNRLPVAAMSTTAPGRVHPDVDISRAPVSLSAFDEPLDDSELAAFIAHVADHITPDAGAPTVLDLAGIDAVAHPDHDVRSPKRQVVALGAAVGAAGLSGPLESLHRVGPRAGFGGDPFDRPWAIERLADGGDRREVSTQWLQRVTRRLRSRRS